VAAAAVVVRESTVMPIAIRFVIAASSRFTA
jgi:hypothetical protein